MSEKTTDESSLLIDETHGFKANIRQRMNDSIIRNQFLEKRNIPFSITLQRLLIFMFVVAGIGVIAFFYLTNDMTRAKFVWLGVTCISVGLVGITALYSLVNPSNGSLLSSAEVLFSQQVRRYMIAKGRISKPRKSNLHNVRKDGVIEMWNGEYAKMFRLDGSTSATAYPSEIFQQELRARSYHDGRPKTTTEVHITSSQKQNTGVQLKNMDRLIRRTTDPAKLWVMQLDYNYMKEHVNGVKPSIVQYLILRDPSEKQLNDSVERLKTFVNRGYYYSMEELDKYEIEEQLSEIFALR